MKNRTLLRFFILTLALLMTLSAFVACDPPVETPDDTTAADNTTEGGDVTTAGGDDVTTAAPDDVTTAAPDDVTTAGSGEEKHIHVYTNNKCSCGVSGFATTNNAFGLTNMTEKASSFDGDGDGVNDKFYFAPALADKFSADSAIKFESGRFTADSKSPSSNTNSYEGLPHFYITEKTDQTLVYTFSVEEEGVYDLAIHLRLKDTKERGNKFTVNPGTDSAYTFETSFKPADDTEISAMKSTDGKDSTYMYGMQIYLNKGQNTILIEASTTEKCQHYRHFYLAKAE